MGFHVPLVLGVNRFDLSTHLFIPMDFAYLLPTRRFDWYARSIAGHLGQEYNPVVTPFVFGSCIPVHTILRRHHGNERRQ